MPRTTLQTMARYWQAERFPDDIRRMLIKAERAGIIGFEREHRNRMQRFIAIVRAYRDGHPVDDIAARFAASRNTVQRYARIAGLPPTQAQVQSGCGVLHCRHDGVTR